MYPFARTQSLLLLKGPKMFRCCFVLFCCLSAFAFSLSAQAPNTDSKQSQKSIPPCIQAGMDAYKAKGPEEAVRAWIKDSPLDGSKDALSQANFLQSIELLGTKVAPLLRKSLNGHNAKPE